MRKWRVYIGVDRRGNPVWRGTLIALDEADAGYLAVNRASRETGLAQSELVVIESRIIETKRRVTA
jgi:hypothetical protein